METGNMIVAIIGVLAVLFLVSRGGTFQRMPTNTRLRMMLIWGAIILALVLVIQFTGFRIDN